MRNSNKVLIIAFAKVDFLLPAIILANHQCSYALIYKEINNFAACTMQIVHNLACALVREPIKSMGDETVLCAENSLPSCTLFIVILVDTLDRTPVNNTWHKTTFV